MPHVRPVFLTDVTMVPIVAPSDRRVRPVAGIPRPAEGSSATAGSEAPGSCDPSLTGFLRERAS
jgi:hypothetical protein